MITDSSEKISIIKSWLGTGSVNIFGRQYSGKDTQCEHLARELDGVAFGGGDILRKSNMPDHVMERINAGHLSPTQEYRAVVTPYFAKKEFAGKPLFLSSVGRMKGEDDVIIEAAKNSNHEIKAVIVLDIDEATTWKRYEHGKLNGTREARVDDEESSITKRLKIYKESTVEVIDGYRDLGLVIDIDGTRDEVTIYQDILSKLYERAIQSDSV